MANNEYVQQQSPVVLLQAASTFNPAAYNFPQFRFKHLPTSEVRNAWVGWIRGFERVMVASGITDSAVKKIQLLAIGGLELQNVFDTIPGADVEGDENIDAYAVAKAKLDNHFSPKHHESFERYLFWNMSPEQEEPIEKFLERILLKAEKCYFGNTILESRQIAVIDKIIQLAPEDLREKLLGKTNLTMEECSKTVNSHQAIRYQLAKMNKTAVSDVHRMYSSSSDSRIIEKFGKNKRCLKCGYMQHNLGERCPAANQICLRCQNLGHFKSVCRSSNIRQTKPFIGNTARKRPMVPYSENNPVFKKAKSVMNVETSENEEQDDDEELPVYNVGDSCDELIKCCVGGITIEMLIDSGSKYNLIDDTTWKMMSMQGVEAKNLRSDSNKTFLAYGKIPLKLVTAFDADIEILGTRGLHTFTSFYVIEKGQQPLLGKVTAQHLGVLRIGLPNQTEIVNQMSLVKLPFPHIRGVELTLPIDRSVAPVIQPLRRCPIPLLDKVKAKLDDLMAQDIIERVERPTSWVSPLVPIIKDSGDLRLCIDMRRANQAIQRLNHPLPIFEEHLTRIRNAKLYSLLDMKDSYYHVMLTEGCRDVTTFITNWGLYRFKRLFFGVNCAPELFQSLIESLLASCKNLIVFIDDLLVFGENETEHDEALAKVVHKLDELGVQLNHHKCKFKQSEVVFLGHQLSAKGVLPSYDKVQSILNCRTPKSKEELRSFLGLVTFVSRFIPCLATANHPLRELIKQSTPFEWSIEHQKSFELLKRRIGSLDYLGYFDPKDRTLLVTDASGVGLGAVLIQYKNDKPRIISYASKSLSQTEINYPPIEKEALAIVWAVERFRIYLIGISFELETDHRPLESIFTITSKPTIRIERWLLRLQGYKFKVVYRKGSANLADSLSRLAAHVNDVHWQDESEVYIRHVAAGFLSTSNGECENEFDQDTEIEIRAIQETAAIDISEVVQMTTTDDELTALKEAIMVGNWCNPKVKHFVPFQNELSYVNGVIMRGMKLVIPKILRNRMCQLAHEGHPGHSAMKSRLRDKCWWPNMDQEAVKVCDQCEGCRLVHASTPPEPMERRKLPEKPWIDLAIDFLGPLPSGEYILVVIDYYSRYMEIEIMKRITAQETVMRLQKIFRTWGYPRTITLDNGKQFVSQEFDRFCKTTGIVLNHTTPYWPQANGEVERQNRSLLKRLKISNALYGDWKAELDDYLILYNNNPHSVTGQAPSELLQKRKLRFKIPQASDISTTPPTTDFRDRDLKQKFDGKSTEDARRGSKPSALEQNDTVLMKNLLPKDKLSTDFSKEKFRVIEKKGSNVTIESQETGKQFERNSSHLLKILEKDTESCDTSLPEEKEEEVNLRRSLRIPKPSVRYSP